jgi:hypothetical protein
MANVLDYVMQTSKATMLCAHSGNMVAIKDLFLRNGYEVHEVDVGGVSDEVELCVQIAAASPGGATYQRLHQDINFMALSDTLVDGLKDGVKYVLLVRNADSLVERHLNLVLSLYSIFVLESRRARDQGFRVSFETILFGTGPNFVDCLAEHEVNVPTPIVSRRSRTPEQLEALKQKNRLSMIEKRSKENWGDADR